MPRRVVVTGIGLICSVGNQTEAVWKSILAGKSGIGPITRFDASQHACRIAGEVKDFDPASFIDKKEVKKMGRFMHFAIAATDEALAMSGLKITPENAERVGVYIGSGIGGFEVIEREHEKLLKGGPDRVSPFFIPASIVNLASGQVSIRTGAKGPNSAVATACTTGAHAIGDSFRLIQHGYADAMIAGGAEATVTPLCVAGFASMKALSTRNDDPEHASRPWDRDHDGFVIGEGSGILLLEDLETAKARGAKILGEIVGYGMSGDAYHMASPSEDGDGPRRVMLNALKDAGLEPTAIDYINAHATSTPAGDVIEARAFKAALGEYAYKVPISSTKAMTGHLLGGAGALEAGITLMAIRDQIAPATMHLDNPAEGCDLDFIPNQARPMKIDLALSNSFGFGGTNGCLIFKRYAE
ncbi:beta-ketoacyl-ACP synthase II [Bryobacter aggregatus]|uniref:beta-ketoacyl-ACP synthase II n=1 Tax=Bryobacter aggregatus TaxID=360054 RepID=UPI0004E1576B|nr:beta-ketoacyl-ACP synthase II [Bryobacter aggregatus]